MAWRCGGQVLAWPTEGEEVGASIYGNAIEGANLRKINLSPYSIFKRNERERWLCATFSKSLIYRSYRGMYVYRHQARAET